MHPESSSALLWFSAILIFVSLMASRDMSLFLLFLALLCAIPPALAGPKRNRILGKIVLVLAGGLTLRVISGM